MSTTKTKPLHRVSHVATGFRVSESRLTITRILTLRRTGTFTATFSGRSHCGVGSLLTVKYDVVVKCDDRLDHRGFLFDQISVDRYFQGIRHGVVSCEKLAHTVSRGLLDLIHGENPQCIVRHLSVSLSPEPFAAGVTIDLDMTGGAT